MIKISGPRNQQPHTEGDADCDDLSAELSPASFREKCAEGGRASPSVEAGQENLIALLLQQQQEVLKEIRGQKKVHLDLT